jgi:hypothetical protein
MTPAEIKAHIDAMKGMTKAEVAVRIRSLQPDERKAVIETVLLGLEAKGLVRRAGMRNGAQVFVATKEEDAA